MSAKRRRCLTLLDAAALAFVVAAALALGLPVWVAALLVWLLPGTLEVLHHTERQRRRQ